MNMPRWNMDAPAFISIAQDILGFNLRAKSVAKAQARIDKVLSCGEAIEPVGIRIRVIERVSSELAGALFGRQATTSFTGSSELRGAELDEVIARHAHQHGDVAAELWRAHGSPVEIQMTRDADKKVRVEWTWNGTFDHYAAWSAFAARSTELAGHYKPVIATTAAWDLRLRLRSGATVGDPLPPSRFIPTFGGAFARGYFYFVFPEMTFAELIAEHDHLTTGMGMNLPLSRFELCAPKRRGDGRSWRRLR